MPTILSTLDTFQLLRASRAVVISAKTRQRVRAPRVRDDDARRAEPQEGSPQEPMSPQIRLLARNSARSAGHRLRGGLLRLLRLREKHKKQQQGDRAAHARCDGDAHDVGHRS